jgi:formylglycine-generating enzyme required for sulfatase activity
MEGDCMTQAVRIIGVAFLGISVLCVASCGEDEQRATWPELSKEQHDEAERLGVPVKFENELGMRFVLIPAGTFLMGVPNDERYRSPRAPAQREVEITQPFYMSICEVTNEQYGQRTVGLDEHHSSGEWWDLSLDGPTQPVVRVRQLDAVAFAKWLSSVDGARTYNLPTAAQWEYACRAGSTTRFWWGDTPEDAHRFANGWDVGTTQQKKGVMQADPFPGDDGHRVTAPVATYEPNPWGLFDMHGNAEEWCADLFDDRVEMARRARSGASLADATSLQESPLRGGSFSSPPKWSRADYELRVNTAKARHKSGFRLVSPLPEKEEE